MKTLKKLMEEEEEKNIWDLFKSVMEGYSDSVIPLLSDFQTESNKNNFNDDNSTTAQIRNNQLQQNSALMVACSSRKKAKKEASSSSVPMEHQKENEKEKERKRRQKITKQFSELQSMLPNYQVTKTQIIEGTIDYIKKLEEEVKGLEAKKKAAMEISSSVRPSTSISPIQNSVVNVTVSGNVAFFGIKAEVYQRPLLFSRVIKVFEKYKMEILTTSVTKNEPKITVISVTALVNSNEGVGRLTDIEAIKGDLIRLFRSRF